MIKASARPARNPCHQHPPHLAAAAVVAASLVRKHVSRSSLLPRGLKVSQFKMLCSAERRSGTALARAAAVETKWAHRNVA